ncbi:hypothetical protein MHYP_G00003010 [Metynnis hypsauchen]
MSGGYFPLKGIVFPPPSSGTGWHAAFLHTSPPLVMAAYTLAELQYPECSPPLKLFTVTSLSLISVQCPWVALHLLAAKAAPTFLQKASELTECGAECVCPTSGDDDCTGEDWWLCRYIKALLRVTSGFVPRALCFLVAMETVPGYQPVLALSEQPETWFRSSVCTAI